MPDGKPTLKELSEATEPLSKDAPLEAKLSHLRDALELSDLLDAIALRSLSEPNSELRFTTAVALRSVIGFLQSMGLSSLTLKRLLLALSELDEGHVHPLVTSPKIAHRKPDSVSVQARKAVAAAAMHLFMDDTEVSKDQAASKVARALTKTSFRDYGNKPIVSSMIATWRDRYIGANSEADAYAASIFRMLVTAARDKFSTPKRQAESVLKTIVAKI